MEQIDTTSVKGALITIGSAWLSTSNVEVWLKLLALCVTIIAGVTTIIYNIKKIKKHEN